MTPHCRLEARGHLMTKKWSSISSQMDFGIRKYMVRGYQKWKIFWFWRTGTSQRTRIKFWPFYLVKRPKLAVFSFLWWQSHRAKYPYTTNYLSQVVRKHKWRPLMHVFGGIRKLLILQDSYCKNAPYGIRIFCSVGLLLEISNFFFNPSSSKII